MVVPSVWLAALPFFMLNNAYFSGGDSSQLYYIKPLEFLNNYSLFTVSKNSLGTLGTFAQESYQAPFFLLLAVIKLIFNDVISTQCVYLSIIFVSSYHFFRNLQKLIYVRLGIKYEEFIISISSLLYVVSPFFLFIAYRNFLHSIALIMVIPAALYYLTKAKIYNKISLVIPGVAIASIFSNAVFGVPWVLGSIIILLPILIFSFKNELIGLKEISFFILFFSLINIYWIYPFILSILSGSQLGSGINNAIQNIDLIKFYASDNSLAHLFQFTPVPLWKKDYTSELIANFNPLVILALTFIAAPIAINDRRIGYIYIILSISLLWAMAIYSLKVNEFNLEIIILLIEEFPFLGMLRNAFDKFALGISFVIFLAIGFSINVWFSSTLKYKKIVLVLIYVSFILYIIFISLFNIWNKPILMNGYTKPIVSSSIIQKQSKLFETFHSLNRNGSVLQFPLNNPSYVIFNDSTNHFYIGTSPFKIFTNFIDYSGFLSFSDDRYAKALQRNILECNTEGFDNFLKKFGIRYIIVNNIIPRDIINGYFYTLEKPGDLYNAQFDCFLKSKDFYMLAKDDSFTVFEYLKSPGLIVGNVIVESIITDGLKVSAKLALPKTNNTNIYFEYKIPFSKFLVAKLNYNGTSIKPLLHLKKDNFNYWQFQVPDASGVSSEIMLEIEDSYHEIQILLFWFSGAIFFALLNYFLFIRRRIA